MKSMNGGKKAKANNGRSRCRCCRFLILFVLFFFSLWGFFFCCSIYTIPSTYNNNKNYNNILVNLNKYFTKKKKELSKVLCLMDRASFSKTNYYFLAEHHERTTVCVSPEQRKWVFDLRIYPQMNHWVIRNTN